MAKYNKHFKTMLKEYSGLFGPFTTLHTRIVEGDESAREEFNTVGQKVVRIIRRYDNELCSKSENSGYAKFSSNLSDKFWEEVRATFPKIDEVMLE